MFLCASICVSSLSRPRLLLARYRSGSITTKRPRPRASSIAGRIADLPFMIQLPALAADVETLDVELFVHADRLQILDGQLGRDGAHVAEAADLAHDLVQHRGDDAAVNEAVSALIFRRPGGSGRRCAAARSSVSKCECMPRGFAAPQPKQGFAGSGWLINLGA